MNCTPTTKQRESLVQRVVGSAQAMAERLLEQTIADKPLLEEMEKAVMAALHGFGNELLSALVEVRSEQYPQPTIACACGAEAHYQRQRRAQCKTLLGTVKSQRAYYLCAHCHRGSCPLDQQLGFCAGSISAGLDELLALLGCQFSFAHSVALVKRLTRVEVSPNRCRHSTRHLAQLVAADEEQRRQQVWDNATLELPLVSQTPLDPLYVSADGVTVHTRKSGWREQCVGAVYTTQSTPRRNTQRPQSRSQAISYTSELGSRVKFGQQLWLEAQRRGLTEAKQVIFIGDGAQWLWEMAHDLFPQAVQILDWYHATTYLWTVARKLHQNDDKGARTWIEPHLAALAQNETAWVLAQLQPLAASVPEARSAITYFTHNLSRMDYARYRTLGLQIGSGTIESSCNHLIAARLKQAGMRWNLEYARCLAKLRTRFKSDRWAETIALRPLPFRSYARSLLC